MNLRQKAKRYKQQVEQLQKLCIPIKEVKIPSLERSIVTVMAEHVLSRDDFKDDSSEKWIREKLANKIGREAIKYSQFYFKEDPTQYLGGKYIVRTKMIDISK